MNFLLDTGATLTLVKVRNLKGNTPVREKQIALTGVTGHKIHTLRRIRATIILGKEEIRHIMYVVKDDFPVAYEEILGIDFLKKHRAKCDHAKEILRIESVNLKLHPYKKYILTPCSETIVQAITSQN
ncbi:hypothetical protein P5V15_005855 [Pogonomyrmex californicus]